MKSIQLRRLRILRKQLDNVDEGENIQQNEVTTYKYRKPKYFDPETKLPFDKQKLSKFLLSDVDPEFRKKYIDIVSSPVMQRDYINLTKEDARVLMHDQTQFMINTGFYHISLQKKNPEMLVQAMNMFGLMNFGVQVKLVVHMHLFGGSILNLGTERHHKYIPDIENMKIKGCFGLTELRGGSNVRAMETTAHYNPERREIIINTPTKAAVKWWLGNAAYEATHCIVFAKLLMPNSENGHDDMGLHPFLVRIRREDNNEACEGVVIGDCGDKLGLNGIDNGFLGFDKVRIPQENMLNRFGSITDDGKYDNPFGRKRFTFMLSELITGRMAIVMSTLKYRRIAVTIATRYAQQRKQFGPPGKDEVPILSYASHQLRIMPILASCFVYDFTKRIICKKYIKVHGENHESTPSDVASLHAYVAGFKAIITWDTQTYLQTLRECCGGLGYSSYNRFHEFKNDNDIKTTFEGDNMVMVQQLANYLIKKFGKTAKEHLINLQKRMLVTDHHFYNPDYIFMCFEYRTYSLIHECTEKLKGLKKKSPEDVFYTKMDLTPDLCALARASVEMRCYKKFIKHISTQPKRQQYILRLMLNIFGLDCIVRDPIPFMSCIRKELLNKAKNKLQKLCKELAPYAVDLCDAFDIPDHIIKAPIGQSDGRYVHHTLEAAVYRNPNPVGFDMLSFADTIKSDS